MAQIGNTVVDAVHRADAAQLERIASGGITWLDPKVQTTAFLADKNYVKATGADVIAALRGCSLKNTRATEAEAAGKYIDTIGVGSEWTCNRPASFLPSTYAKRECYDQGYWLNAKPSAEGVILRLNHSLRWNTVRCGPERVPSPPPAPPTPR